MKTLLVALLCLAAICSRALAEPAEVVAAENFYGNVAQQIFEGDVHVTSILSNPNQDPHEFTTDAATAHAVEHADIVIYNGLGYDDWMGRLLATNSNPNRIVIKVADLIGAKDGDNPHIWYNPRTMPALVDKLGALHYPFTETDSVPIDQNIDDFKRSLQPELDKIVALKAKYGGTTVTATEPVFGYMASALGFKMLNYDFQLNIMNDTEPTAGQTEAFEQSLKSHTAKLLFYNSQVVDPTTDRMKKLAQQAGIPIIGVTETQPQDQKTYAEWMMHELDAVEAGLAAAKP